MNKVGLLVVQFKKAQSRIMDALTPILSKHFSKASLLFKKKIDFL